jgi:hypothetical protein
MTTTTTTNYRKDWNSKLPRNACNLRQHTRSFAPKDLNLHENQCGEPPLHQMFIVSTNNYISIILSLCLFFRIYWNLVLPLPGTLTIIRMSFPTTYSCPRLLTVVSACLSFSLDEPLISVRVSFYYGATAPSGPGFLIFEVSRSLRHTILRRTPLDEWPVRRRVPLPHQHITLTRDKLPCLQRDSNQQSQQASGRKPTL